MFLFYLYVLIKLYYYSRVELYCYSRIDQNCYSSRAVHKLVQFCDKRGLIYSRAIYFFTWTAIFLAGRTGDLTTYFWDLLSWRRLSLLPVSVEIHRWPALRRSRQWRRRKPRAEIARKAAWVLRAYARSLRVANFDATPTFRKVCEIHEREAMKPNPCAVQRNKVERTHWLGLDLTASKWKDVTR